MIGERGVSRVVRRKPNPGCEEAYENLLKGMLEASSKFPGYLSATVLPPHAEHSKNEYLIIQRFATQDDLDRWDGSAERELWHQRIQVVSEQNAVYFQVGGLEVWFPSSPVNTSSLPPKWKMTVVSWFGIFPTAAICIAVFGPLLESWPFLTRMALITAVVAFLMSYVVMPRISVGMRWWLKK